MKVLLRVWSLLTPHERRQCIALQVLSLVMGLVTVAGIAAVMPFFAVLGDPSLAQSNPALHWLHAQLPSLDERGFTLFLGAGFIALLVASSPGPIHTLSSKPTRMLAPIAAAMAAIGSC